VVLRAGTGVRPAAVGSVHRVHQSMIRAAASLQSPRSTQATSARKKSHLTITVLPMGHFIYHPRQDVHYRLLHIAA
jgi:hypothetical protein